MYALDQDLARMSTHLNKIIVYVTPAPVMEIKFSSPSTERKSDDLKCSSSKTRKRPVPKPTDEEIEKFYSILNSAKRKPAILKITSHMHNNLFRR